MTNDVTEAGELEPIEIPPVEVKTWFRISDRNDEPLAHASVIERHGVLMIENLWTDESVGGQGYATEILKTIIVTFGSENLYVYVGAWGDQPLADTDLIEWYEGFGFELVGDFPGGMVRPGTPLDESADYDGEDGDDEEDDDGEDEE